MFKDAINGKASNRFNPIKAAANYINPQYGDTAYNVIALAANVAALTRQVPVVMGYADGMNRPNSIFGASTSVWNNGKAVPYLEITVPRAAAQVSAAASAAFAADKVGIASDKVNR